MLASREPRRPQATLPVILAGLFGGTAFATYLEDAAAGMCTLERCDDRARLVHTITAKRPRALLLPTVDRHEQPTAPLVLACRRTTPDVPIVMLLERLQMRGANVVGAVRSGARVAVAGSPDELRVVIGTMLTDLELSPAELRALTEVLAGVGIPDAPRAMLEYAAVEAHRRVTVADLARRVGMSTRTLARMTRASRSPSGAEIVVWGRLLRASIMVHRDDGPSRNLAAATGYCSLSSLEKAFQRLMPAATHALRVGAPTLESIAWALALRLSRASRQPQATPKRAD